MQDTVCRRCGQTVTGPNDWCETCQRRASADPIIRYEKRSSSRKPRRWRVNRRYLHLTAALMSLVIPGAGQIYKGRIAAGVAWLIVVAFVYWLVGAPGILIHLMCVITAGSAARVMRRPFLASRINISKR